MLNGLRGFSNLLKGVPKWYIGVSNKLRGPCMRWIVVTFFLLQVEVGKGSKIKKC